MKRIIKLILLCIVIPLMELSAIESNMQQSILNINLSNVSLREAIKTIETTTSYVFFYNNEDVDLDRKVNLNVNNGNIKDVLEQILGKYGYRIENNKIVILPKGYQQYKRITGVIIDGDNQPVIGANVVEKGTTNGTITDIDGKFSLDINAGAILEISYIGYLTKEIEVGDKSNLSVSLIEDTKTLDEVVVVGYGVQKKKLVTGATVQVKGDELQKLNTVSPLGALQSQAPGVSIVKSSGLPGDGFKVSIRGIGTTGSSSPLYIVDGVTVDNIDNLSPSDIESIDVLKDAASAAIYGARAANGVVLVATKQGKKGNASISYDGYVGIQNIYKKVDALNAQEYAMIMNEAALNSGMPEYDFSKLIPNWDKIESGEWKGTNWLNEIENKNAFMQNHSLGIRGGTDQSVYSMGLSYISQEGILGNPAPPSYDRYTFRVNTEHKLIKGNSFDILTFGENLNFSHTLRNTISMGNWTSNDIYNAMKTSPFLPLYDKNGDYHYALDWNTNDANPVGIIDYMRSGNLNKSNHLTGNVYMVLQPIKGLTYRSSFGINFRSTSSRSFIPVFDLGPMPEAFRAENEVSQNLSTGLKWVFENTLNYVTKIREDHNLNILVGTSAEKSGMGESISGKNVESIFDDFTHAYLDNAKNIYPGKTTLSGSPWKQGRLLSFFGRVNYDYKEKYLLTLVMRADASSNFAPDNRWGYFPSISGGWVISNEPFMQKSSSWMDLLKLRVSWGRNGNQDIDPFQYLSTIAFTTRYYPGIDKINSTPGAFPNILANPDITWETSEQTDIGLDTRFLNGRLGFSFDWYNKVTKDWLVQAPIQGIMGTGAPYINGGDVRNRGWEMALSWQDNLDEFRYGINMNWAYNKNKVLRIANTEGIIHGEINVLSNQSPECYRAEVGYPIGYFWGYRTGGVFQNQQQIDSYVNSKGEKIMPDAVPGDLIFINQNDDSVIDDKDKVMIGDPNPDFTFSLSLNLAYKGFDLSMTSNGVLGNQIIKSYRRFMDKPQENYAQDILGRWHGEGTSNTIPRVTMDNHINDTYISDRYVENGDYWRISNLTLGYDFKHIWKKLPLSQARFYVTGQNILTLTGYSGFDPEVGYGNNWAGGIDLGFYPAPISFLFGVSLKY